MVSCQLNRPRPGSRGQPGGGLGRLVGGILRESVPEPVRFACSAHLSLRMADWAIRELSAADVTTWLRIAAEVRHENGLVPP